MSKAVIRIGYTDYVMETKDAVAVAEAMQRAELYKERWRKVEDGGTTYHIWEQTEFMELTIKPLPDTTYKMYKLAGAPQD